MDPITHGVVGLAIAAFTGEAVAIANPYAIGSLIGAVIPDADIIMQVRGDYSYLKNHRGMSHSIPFIFLYGIAVASLLAIINPGVSLLKLFLYTLSGCVSHILVDIANPYGAQVLWPIIKKRYTLNLLLVYDPFLIIISSMIIFPFLRSIIHPWISIGVFTLYLALRYWMKSYAKKIIKSNLGRHQYILSLKVLPSMAGLVNWHYIVKIKGKTIIGEVNIIPKRFTIIETMDDLDNKLIKAVSRTRVAEFFSEFTPAFHIKCNKTNDGYEYDFIDLRYYIAKDFLHHATAVLDENFKLVTSIFHPYRRTRNVEL